MESFLIKIQNSDIYHSSSSLDEAIAPGSPVSTDEETNKKESGTVKSMLQPVLQSLDVKEWDWKSASKKAFSQDPLKEFNVQSIERKTKSSPYKQPKSRLSRLEKLRGLAKDHVVPKVELEQTSIDAGQKCGQTVCSKCGMLYVIANKEDEQSHRQYCQSLQAQKVVIKSWSQFKLIQRCGESKIIVITEDDIEENTAGIKGKLNLLYKIMSREMGSPVEKTQGAEEMKLFLYLDESDRVLAAVVAERVEKGFQVIDGGESTDESIRCSSTETKVLCGINKIWTLSGSRRSGIASKLLDSIKVNMYYGYRLSNQEIAITQPSISGKPFFSNYFNTNQFILYNIAM